MTTAANTTEAERGFSGYGTSTRKEIRQRQSAKKLWEQSQQKTKGMKATAQRLGEQKPLMDICPHQRICSAAIAAQDDCALTGEFSLFTRKDIYCDL